MESEGKSGTLFALALFTEVIATLLLFGPFGSVLSNIGWGDWFVGWAIICGAMLLVPWAVRWLGGPKPFRLFWRDSPYKLWNTLYLGLLVGVVITAYKALLSLVLSVYGVPFEEILREWSLRGNADAFLPGLAVSLAAAYFIFGYLQGLLARVFGERGGMLIAALLFALGSAWPLDSATIGLGGVPQWFVFAAGYLPFGIALAHLGARTRSVLAVLIAVLTIEWLAGIGAAVNSALGFYITALAIGVMLLIGIEVII
ncbi:MAG: hypothetical protein GY771_13820, partial [bacterium]|nr:hypothetical protein [bacterium]